MRTALPHTSFVIGMLLVVGSATSGFAEEVIATEEISVAPVSEEAVEKMIDFVSREVAEKRAREEGGSASESVEPIVMSDIGEQTIVAGAVESTFNAQRSVSSRLLEHTESPDVVIEISRDVVSTVSLAGGDYEYVASVVTAEHSTETIATIPGPASLEVVAEVLVNSVPIEENAKTMPKAFPLTRGLVIVPLTHVAPVTSEFGFEFTGQQFPTVEATDEWEEPVKRDVENPVVGIVKESIGLTGSCSDTYYVILLYKKASDYARDPKSHVMNRAYLCIGGHFSYILNNFPARLESGTYYLLVGAQGVRGEWRPKSDLLELTIRNAR